MMFMQDCYFKNISISISKVKDPFIRQSFLITRKINTEEMINACKLLLGEKDLVHLQNYIVIISLINVIFITLDGKKIVNT